MKGDQGSEGPTLAKQLVDDQNVDKEGDLSEGEDSTNSDMVEVPIETPKLQSSELELQRSEPELRRSEADIDLPELDPDVHADPEHRWDIATMTVKEALANWKGEAVKAAMDEEIRSLISNGTWELVERPCGVNIMKNWWVLTTKYRIDDTVEREKARLVVKGFTQVYGANYAKTYSSMSSYVTLRIFLSIVAVLDLNLMQLDMENSLLQKALDGVLLGAGWKKSQVDKALYFKNYADKLRRRFIDEEQTGRIPKTPVSVYAYAELTFDYEDSEEREEEYQQKVGSLQFATTMTRPYIAFTCSKLGSGLTVRSDQHWCEVDRSLAYLVDTRDTALEFGGIPDLLKLVGYVDADDAGNKQNRTSTGSYIFVYGGVAVSWLSSRIKCATLSSTELEYVVATDAGKEGRRLRFLLVEFRQLNAGTLTVLRVDNKSANTVAEGLGLTGNLKHMDRRYAWLQHMARSPTGVVLGLNPSVCTSGIPVRGGVRGPPVIPD
ncbi:unnamed protein product [Closterium sp. NIES-54]